MVKIYGLIDPKTGTIRYVGKTVNDLKHRLSAHISESRNLQNNHPKHRWIRKVFDSGDEPNIVLIEEVDDEIWEDREKYWINFYKHTNNLTNISEGGIKPPNHQNEKRSEETKKKLSMAHKALKRDRSWTEESKQKMIISLRKIKPHQEQEVSDLFANNVPVKEIAEKFNVTESAIKSAVHRLKVRRKTKIQPENHQQIMDWRAEGKSLKFIAKELNCESTIVSIFIKSKLNNAKLFRRSLTSEQVLEVKELSKTTKTVELMKRYNCSQNTILRAINGEYD